MLINEVDVMRHKLFGGLISGTGKLYWLSSEYEILVHLFLPYGINLFIQK